jgi:hypothetical protein
MIGFSIDLTFKTETPAKHYLKAENYRNILSDAAAE